MTVYYLIRLSSRVALINDVGPQTLTDSLVRLLP